MITDNDFKPCITVIGKRWWDRSNTYHSCEVYLNNKLLERVPFQYGYESAYQQTALKILQKNDIGKDVTAVWHLRDRGYNILDNVVDVSRKKDL